MCFQTHDWNERVLSAFVRKLSEPSIYGDQSQGLPLPEQIDLRSPMSKVHSTDSPTEFGASTKIDTSPSERNADQRFPFVGIEKNATDETSLPADLSNEVWQSISDSLEVNAQDKRTLLSVHASPEVKSLLNGFELVTDNGSHQSEGSAATSSQDSSLPDETAVRNKPSPAEQTNAKDKTAPLDRIPPDKAPPQEVLAIPKEEKADSQLAEQPKQETDPRLEALRKRIASADRIDPRLAVNDVLAGQIQSVDLLEVLTNKEIASKENKPLLEVSARIDQQKFNSYVAYLSPATTRADLALARITTGDAEQVKQGKRELIEALRLRPELQFNVELQNAIEAAFKIMAESRQRAGLPPLGTANSVVYSPESGTNTKIGTDNGTGAPATTSGTVDSTSAYEKLTRASQIFQQKDIDAAAPAFQQAISESDKLDQRAMTEQRLQIFARKLELTSQIAEKTAQGKNTDSLQSLHRKVAEREWESYKNYLSPASIRTNTAMAMIASGNEKYLVEAKKLLAESIRLRPELEFSKEYGEHLKKAFEAHHQNKPVSNQVEGNKQPVNEKVVAQNQIDIKPGYKPFDAEKKTTPVAEIENEPEMERYLSDRLTGPVLTAGLLYLGYRSVKSQYNRRLERARVARLSDLLRVPEGEAGNEGKTAESEGKTTENRGAENRTDKVGENKSVENRSADNSQPENKTSTEPVRPRRRIVERENLGRQGIEITSDGTRKFTGAQGELMKLSWKERLTDTEMQELEKTRKELERRVEKGDKLSKEESKQLDALNHFEKNKFDAKLHKKIVESIEKSRPEGGFRARDAVGPVIGISIITSAIIGYYLNSRGESREEPLKRAKFDK